jgi:hypothetical protein
LNEFAGRNPKQPEDEQEPTVAGQPLVLSMKNRIGSGAFSVVVRHPDDGTVYKLFREREENDLLNDNLGDHEPALRRKAFESEVAAYGIAMNNDAVRSLVPTFHGKVVVDHVLDVYDGDISNLFLLECCYVIDFVEGAAVKFTQELASKHAHLHAATEELNAIGIRYWHDGSVFHPANPELTKIIDFALDDEYGKGIVTIACAD